MKKYHHMFSLFGLGAYAVVVTICSLVGQYGCSASSPQSAPSTVSSSTTTTPAPDPVDVLDLLHGKVSFEKPTPNPWWYGQGPYAKKPVMANSFSGSFGPPVYQASWAQPLWNIDPANSTGCASDTNKTCGPANCATTGDGPCLTFAQVAARWGTYAPRIRQPTKIFFLSSQPDNTDPVILHPYIENAGYIDVECIAPTPSQTGTLASVVAKNQSTPQLLNVTFGSATTANQFVINATHPSAAFTYTNSSGNAWNMSQPLAALTVPYGVFSAGTEVNTWANGDAYSIYPLYSVLVVDYEPIWVNGTTTFGDAGYLNFCSVPALGTSPVSNFNGNVAVSQSVLNTEVLVGQSGLANSQGYFEINVMQPSLLQSAIPYLSLAGVLPLTSVRGGYVEFPLGAGVSLTKGVIVAPSSVQGPQTAVLNDVYIDNNSGTHALGLSGVSQVSGPVWGPGSISLLGTARLCYPAAGGAAVANFLNAGAGSSTIEVNGSSNKACSHTFATPDVVSCNITITPAALDAAQGAAGFGGLAYLPGGASISNTCF